MTETKRTASPDDIDITALWRAVMDRKNTLLAGVVGIGALTFAALSLMTPEYTATTLIIIENDQSVFDRPSGQDRRADDSAKIDKEAVGSQVHVLQSNDLASEVVNKLQLSLVPEFNDALRSRGFVSGLIGGEPGGEEERLLRSFADHLTVYPVKGSRIISVSMSSADPKLAADAANTLAQGYIAWQRGRQVDRTKGESESLGRQLADLREEVEKADFKLEKFRSETGLYSGQNNTTLNAQQLSEVNSQLSLAKARRSEAEARARQIRQMLRNGNVDSAPDVLRSQLIQRLLEQKVQVQRRISELSVTLLSGHPRMRQLAAERAGISSQIRREVRKIVAGLENEARIARAREMSLRNSLDQVRAQAASSGNNQVRLTLLEREARSKRTVYEAMLAKFDEASSRSVSRAAPVYARIVDKARVTSIPSFPKKLPMTIFAMVAALLLGLAGLVTRALLHVARPLATKMPDPENPGPRNGRNRLRTVKTSGFPNGAIATVSGTDNGSSPIRTEFGKTTVQAGVAPFVGISDVVPSTRTRCASTAQVAELLLNRGREKPCFRTMVTTAPEGGSAVAAAQEIAAVMAAGGVRTLVLSGKQSLEQNGNASMAVPDSYGGFTDVINGSISLHDAIGHDNLTGVDTIDAGRSSLDWRDMRNAETVNLVLDNLDESYDQVLFAAEPGTATEIFRLTEGRFDHGVVSGAADNGANTKAMFPGFNIPECHVATIVPASRTAPGSRHAQFGTVNPAA